MKNIVENNKLIAEFMGIIFTKDNKANHPRIHAPYPPIENFKYHADWNWLMEVVEKIESKGFDVFINTCVCRVTDVGEDRFEDIETFNSASKIQAVYSAVVEFIKWYNEQK